NFPANQAEFAPPANGLGRDIQAPGQIFKRNWWSRGRQGLDEQGQIMTEVQAGNQQVGIRLGTELGDPKTDELIRIRLARLDFAQQVTGSGQLFGPTSRRRETHLLIRQLLQCMMLEACHSQPHFPPPPLACCFLSRSPPSVTDKMALCDILSACEPTT